MATKAANEKANVQKLKKLRGGFTANPNNNCGTGIVTPTGKTTTTGKSGGKK